MDDNARQQQRKHVSMACTKCREAHRCCDGEIPCRRCRSRNLQCVYDKSKEKPRRIADKNVVYVDPQHYCLQNTKVAQASSIPQAVPQADINTYLNYYALEFNKTAHFSLTLPVSCTLLPQSFPISMNNIREDQKFRVCSALALTALGMGHTTQGHVLMDQAKKYVPEALESCTVDAAIGFNSLGSCYMMEFQLTPTTNYLKLSKNVALSIWRMQKRDQNNLIVEAANTAPIVVHSLMKLLQLNMTSFNSDGNLDYAIKWTQKKLDQLSDVIMNAQMHFNDLHSLAVGLFSLYMADVGSVFQAINNVEVAARNLAWKWHENSHIFMHLVRSLKYAILKDDLAMRNECGLLLQVFDRMTTHNSTSITSLYTTALLWSALGLENELQLLVLIAQRMSLSFPGGKFIVERFGDKSAREAEATKWNPFKELLTKVNLANSNINSCLNDQTVLVYSQSDQDSYPSESKETNSTTDPLYFTFEDLNDAENINNEFYSENYFEPPLS